VLYIGSGSGEGEPSEMRINLPLTDEARLFTGRFVLVISTSHAFACEPQPFACRHPWPPLPPELAQGKRNACILICDITRPVPNGLILPPLIESLTQAGISRENILILVATGLHRPNEGEELAEIVGSSEIQHTFRVENHFARDREAHVDLGRTSTGIPIMIDRRFVEADLKIVIARGIPEV
jgi:hypothetical protein